MSAEASWFPNNTHPHRGILDHRYDDRKGHRWSTECVCGWRSPVEDSRSLAEAGHLLHIAFAGGRLER